jgi:predicted nucleotidyltransferase component of viral defense system
MIKQKEIIEYAHKHGVPKTTVDKDWLIGHYLNAMYSLNAISKNFIFKGGTCLKKCYFENFRFSQDLDFTLLDRNFPIDKKFVNKVNTLAEKNSGAKLHLSEINYQMAENIDQGYEIKIKFWGADHKPNQKPLSPKRWQTSIKLDISFSEKLTLKSEMKNIIHQYSDKKFISNKVNVYSLEEIIAEKIRSLIQRNRPRDIYDIWYLSTIIEESQYKNIQIVLHQKAKGKNIPVESLEQFINEQKREINKKAWQSSLEYQVGENRLPEFNETYSKLEVFIENILNC